MTKKKRKCVHRKKLIQHVEVTKKLLLKNMFFQKINILASGHKTTYIQSTSSQKNIEQTEVIKEVI